MAIFIPSFIAQIYIALPLLSRHSVKCWEYNVNETAVDLSFKELTVCPLNNHTREIK